LVRDHEIGTVHLIALLVAHFAFLSRTPGPPPFSAMNSTPADLSSQKNVGNAANDDCDDESDANKDFHVEREQVSRFLHYFVPRLGRER
jgi:hypothetical protein